jgi:hypothetical protein
MLNIAIGHADLDILVRIDAGHLGPHDHRPVLIELLDPQHLTALAVAEQIVETGPPALRRPSPVEQRNSLAGLLAMTNECRG